MSDKTIYDKLNLINQKTNDIKQTLVDYELTTPDEASLENLPIIIGDFLEKSGGINPYEKFYMQRTGNETNLIGLFAYTPSSATLDLSMMNTSKVTDMTRMFSECKAPYVDLSGFDVSNVSKAEYMFYYCTSEINIDDWDTNKLTNANYMFSSFTNGGKYLDLSVLDFSNVTKSDNMFESCNVDNIDIRNLNLNLVKLSNLPFKSVKGTVLDLSNYDITGLKSTYQLCYFCDCKTVDLTNWKTTEVTDMRNTFYYCTSIEKIIMPDWDMTNVTNTSSFFYSCSKLNYIDLSRSNDATIAKIATLVPAQKLATYGQILIPADSSQANIDALIAKYWKPVGPRIDMTSCEIDTELDEIKPGKTTKFYYGNSEPWYGNDANVEYVSSDESVATVDKETMTVTSTGVEGTTEITARIADTQEVISEPKVLSVSETDSYPNIIKFRGTSTPNNTYNYIYVNGTNSSNKVLLSAMDYNAVSGIYTYDAGAPITSIQFNGYGNQSNALNTCTEVIKINTSNMTSMEKMFHQCIKLTALDLSNFDTSNMTSMNSMFYYCSSLTTLDLSSFNTSNVTNMENMFSNCSGLTKLDLSNFNTSKVADMSYMFRGCTNLVELDLSNFDASNIIDVNYKIEASFLGCNKLHTLRLDNCSNDTIKKIINSGNFPTDTIEGVTRKIYCKEENAAGLIPPTNWIFVDCESDEEIIPPPRPYVKDEFKNNASITAVNVLVTSEHDNLQFMFSDCRSLTTIYGLEQWDTSNVTSMKHMFSGCYALTELDLSHFNTSKVNVFEGIFYFCTGLTTLDIRNFDMTNTTYYSGTFTNCNNLHTLRLDNCNNITISRIITNLPTNAIEGVTRKIYCKEENAAGLTPPTNWIFEFVD